MIVPDDGFSFVDCLDGTGFGAGVVMIFAPEYEKFFLLAGRQPGQYVSDIALCFPFRREGGRICRRCRVLPDRGGGTS